MESVDDITSQGGYERRLDAPFSIDLAHAIGRARLGGPRTLAALTSDRWE